MLIYNPQYIIFFDALAMSYLVEYLNAAAQNWREMNFECYRELQKSRKARTIHPPLFPQIIDKIALGW